MKCGSTFDDDKLKKKNKRSLIHRLVTFHSENVKCALHGSSCVLLMHIFNHRRV